jgi:hypothetical protein
MVGNAARSEEVAIEASLADTNTSEASTRRHFDTRCHSKQDGIPMASARRVMVRPLEKRALRSA